VTGIEPTTSGLLDQRRSHSDNQASFHVVIHEALLKEIAEKTWTQKEGFGISKQTCGLEIWNWLERKQTEAWKNTCAMNKAIIKVPKKEKARKILLYERNTLTVIVEMITEHCRPRKHLQIAGPGCPSGYDAGLTNQTSLVRFPSPLNVS